MKVRTSILIEKEILEKAHELGLNVSKITENALKEYIEAIEKRKMTNGGEFLGEASLEKKVQRARWDLNPRSPAPKADALIRAGLRALQKRL